MTLFKTRSRINVDITFRCSLECPSCQRQFAFKERGKSVHGHDISLDDIKNLQNILKVLIFVVNYLIQYIILNL